MKQFFKFLTASCLGTLLAIGLLVFILIGIGALGTIGANDIDKNSVLLLDLKHSIPEKTDNIKSQGQFNIQEYDAIGLHRIIDLIEHAETNDVISGIVLEGSQNGFGPSSVFEIEKALRSFKDSGKFVYAYGDYYTQQGYFLASVADSIFLHEIGSVDMRGFGIMIPFFKELMDRIGIKMNIFYAGDYKSATEPYRRKSMSEQNKEQTREYLEKLSSNFIERVAINREKSSVDVSNCIDDFCLRDADAAIANGFVDVLSTKSEFSDLLREKLGITKTKGKINYIDIYEYHNKITIKPKVNLKNQIALVYAEGNIEYKSEGSGVVSENKYVKIFDKIIKNDKIKAVVLRVNSPGGSALTSDIIWSKVEEVKATGKPVIASFGDYAASGGYYIACGADSIVAQPNTLTGSIGVFTMFPQMKELMQEKIGIDFDTVKTAPMAVALSPMFDLSNQEIDFMKKSTNDIYDRFLKVVSHGRDMTVEEVHQVAQGRIWIGDQGKAKGLVDEIGDLDDAIAIAAEKADMDDYSIREYPFIKVNQWQEIINEIMKGQDASVVNIDAEDLRIMNYYKDLKNAIRSKEPLMRMPYIISSF